MGRTKSAKSKSSPTFTVSIRFESKKQVERLREAAKLRRWSFNTFVVAACDVLEEQINKSNSNGNVWGDRATNAFERATD